MSVVSSAAPTLARRAWLPVRERLPLALGAVALLAFSWYSWPLEPSAGLDPSWTAAIYMATDRGLDYGTQFVWTYGPLGFLKIPQLWDSQLATIALVYRAAIRLAFIVVVLRRARGWLGLVGAVVLILVTLALVDDVVPALAFALGIFLVERRVDDRRLLAWGAIGGAVAAIEVLGKTNTGLTVVGLLLIAILAPRTRRWRLLGVFAGTGVVVGLVLWTITGNPLSALPAFARNGARIISGYSATQLLDQPERVWEYSAALVVAVIGLFVSITGTRDANTPIRVGVPLMWLLLGFTMFKQGFVRHDGGHSPIYFSTMLSSLPFLPWRREERAFGVMACAATALIVMSITNLTITQVIAPSRHLSPAWKSLKAVLSPGERGDIQQHARRYILSQEGLSPKLVRLVGRHTVHAFPTETAAIWADRLNWRPFPVPQTYQAYTQGLDQLGADFLKSPRAPERILLQVGGFLDGRVLAYDSPATTMAMLCRYRLLGRSGNWAVLARRQNRCGNPKLIGSVQSSYGKPVEIPVPPPGKWFVITKVAGVQVHGLERLRSALFKAHERRLTLDGTDVHRMVPGTAGDGLPVRSSPGLDMPAPFSLVPEPQTLQIARLGDNKGPLRYDFYAIPVS